jgi:hypothetical protein
MIARDPIPESWRLEHKHMPEAKRVLRSAQDWIKAAKKEREDVIAS